MAQNISCPKEPAQTRQKIALVRYDEVVVGRLQTGMGYNFFIVRTGRAIIIDYSGCLREDWR